MEYNGFKIGDLDSLENKIFSTQKTVYDAPERAVEMLTIPGRNGAIALDQGRWENQPVTYRCGCYAESDEKFAERIAAFRSKLLLKTSYEILTDSYNPDEFRLGLYKNGLEADTVSRNHAGEFDVEFDCKPQRFLVSGNDPKTVGEWGETTKLSGDIVTFESGETDAFKSLSVEMEPVQDLHGYDHPWVGGAGKNKLNDANPVLQNVTYQNGVVTEVNADTKTTASFVLQAFNNGSYVRNIGVSQGLGLTEFTKDDTFNQISFGHSGSKADAKIRFDVSNLPNGDYKWCYTPINYTTHPFSWKDMMIVDASVTDYSYEPYSNLCPISGWDSVEAVRAGKNLLATDSLKNGVYISNSNGEEVSYSSWSASGFIPIETNTIYRLLRLLDGSYTFVTGQNLYWAMYDENFNFVQGAIGDGIITELATARYLRVSTQTAKLVGDKGVLCKNEDLDYFKTEADYVDGTTHTATFNETVYGGTLDVVSGVLTVDMAMVSLDSFDYEKTSLNRLRATVRLTGAKTYRYSEQQNNVCSALRSDSDSNVGANVNGNSFAIGGDRFFYIYSEQYKNDPTGFKTAMSGQTLVYELAQPQTYQLDPQTINTLVGVNNVWANAGAVTVEYGASPYIFYNDTGYPAKPLIVITGNGTVGVGKHLITVEGATSPVYIDCESMEIYTESGGIISGASSLVSFNTNEFPTLEAGANGVSVGSGISSVVITPRWWRL